MATQAFDPKFMKVGVLTAALQELTPREVRDPDPDRAIEEWIEFARELPYKAGVVAIPTSVFSADPARLAPYLRFAFCKRLPVIDEAARRLHALES